MKRFAFVLALLLGSAAGAFAQAPGLTVELNKFEQDGGAACRAFFLFHNQLGKTLEAFEMSFAILDTQGVINQLLTVDAAPVPVARTTLKLFEFPDITCDKISEILLHDIAACRPQNGEEMNCFEALTLESKAKAKLVK